MCIRDSIYRAGIKYKNENLILNMDLNVVNGQVLMYTNGYDSYGYADKSYFTWDLGAQYKINKDVKVFIKGHNLTNARYQEYGGKYSNGEAKYPMPSRSFIVGMEYNI